MTTVDPRYPAQIHALWKVLEREVTWLHGRWIMYRQLFGTSEERVNLLNDSAGTFFNVLQDVLLHDVQLSLSKLGDKASSRQGDNATLDALRGILLANGEVATADAMANPLSRFKDACEKVRHRRNKWIAHYDRPTMLNDEMIPRMGPSREEIEIALNALRDSMNCISRHYTGTTIGYEHFIMDEDGEALITKLRMAVRYKELVEMEQVAADDFRARFKGIV